MTLLMSFLYFQWNTRAHGCWTRKNLLQHNRWILLSTQWSNWPLQGNRFQFVYGYYNCKRTRFSWSSNCMPGDLGYSNGYEGSLRVLFLQSLGWCRILADPLLFGQNLDWLVEAVNWFSTPFSKSRIKGYPDPPLLIHILSWWARGLTDPIVLLYSLGWFIGGLSDPLFLFQVLH